HRGQGAEQVLVEIVVAGAAAAEGELSSQQGCLGDGLGQLGPVGVSAHGRAIAHQNARGQPAVSLRVVHTLYKGGTSCGIPEGPRWTEGPPPSHAPPPANRHAPAAQRHHLRPNLLARGVSLLWR